MSAGHEFSETADHVEPTDPAHVITVAALLAKLATSRGLRPCGMARHILGDDLDPALLELVA